MALGCALIGALQLCSGSLKDLSFVHLPRHGRVSRDLPGNHKLHPRRLKKLYESGVLGHNSSLVHIEQQEIHPECGAATADAPQASWAGLQFPVRDVNLGICILFVCLFFSEEGHGDLPLALGRM